MKKNLFSTMMCAGLAGMFMASCSNDIEDLFDPTYATTKAQYKAEWIKQFGEINPQHNWGFGSAESRALTRWANTNQNQWAETLNVPANITDDEVQKVLAVFNNPINAEESVNVNWSDFFVQHVYTGNNSYTTEPDMNGATQTVSPKLDQLQTAYMVDGVLTDEHVNNFNATTGSIMCMLNSGTLRFGYDNPLDNGAKYYDYVIMEIDGSYYVGFDYSCNEANARVKADGIYNDWIVKISPATYKNASRIICEDLGTIGDFDFNDLVFDAYVETDWSTGSAKYTAIITVRAAGGTMPIYIGDKEIHEAFGVEATTMVNTNAANGASKPVVVFRVPVSSNDLNQISIKVQGTEAQYSLDAPQGDAPQKICVKPSFKWCDERVNILTAYPGFADYSQNPEAVWY